FVYVRLHGDEQLYVSGYTDEALDRWAAKVQAWRAGREPADARRAAPPVKSRRASRDVYVYFDNDVKVRAPVDAIGLARRLGLPGPAHALPTFSAAAVAEEPRAHWPAARRAIEENRSR